ASRGISRRSQRQRLRRGHGPVPHYQLYGARSDRERQRRGGRRIGRRRNRLRELPHATRHQFRRQDGILTMKTRLLPLLAGCLSLLSGCQDFLDVNTNPNGPPSVSANLYLPPMLHWLVTSPQYDGRFVGRYAQEWTLPGTTSLSTWDRLGYDPASNNAAEPSRDVY